jgi:hypothetical protein
LAKVNTVRALAMLLVGLLLILAGAFGAVLLLVRQNCGSDLSYYGCDVPPTASTHNGSDNIAHMGTERRFNMP